MWRGVLGAFRRHRARACKQAERRAPARLPARVKLIAGRLPAPGMYPNPREHLSNSLNLGGAPGCNPPPPSASQALPEAPRADGGAVGGASSRAGGSHWSPGGGLAAHPRVWRPPAWAKAGVLRAMRSKKGFNPVWRSPIILPWLALVAHRGVVMIHAGRPALTLSAASAAFPGGSLAAGQAETASLLSRKFYRLLIQSFNIHDNNNQSLLVTRAK